jgi:hypothetical protein
MSIGKTSTTFNDIRATMAVPSVTARFRKYTADNDSVVVNDGESVVLRNSVASTRTTYKFRIKFTGTFVD